MSIDEQHRVVIVGAGLGGIGAAVQLLRRGISGLVVIEAAGSPGGTWRVNSYPGRQCDIPSSFYSLSFAPNPTWSTTFPLQPDPHRGRRPRSHRPAGVAGAHGSRAARVPGRADPGRARVPGRSDPGLRGSRPARTVAGCRDGVP